MKITNDRENVDYPLANNVKLISQNKTLIVYFNKDEILTKSDIVCNKDLDMLLETCDMYGIKPTLFTREQVLKLLPIFTYFIKGASNKNKVNKNFVYKEDIKILEINIIDAFGIKHRGQLRSKTRKKDYVVARQLMGSMLKIDGKTSFADVAKELNLKSHSTIIHSIKAIKNYIDTKDFRYYNPIVEILKLYKLHDTFIEYTERK